MRILFAFTMLLFHSVLGRVLVNEIPRRSIRMSHKYKHVPMSRMTRKENSAAAKSWVEIYTSPPGNISAVLNDNVVLKCEASGTPAPVIYWLKEGRLNAGDFLYKEQEEENTNSIEKVALPFPWGSSAGVKSRLFLDCLNEDSEGLYTCVAENQYSRVSASTILTVKGHIPKFVSPCKSVRRLQGQASRIYLWTSSYLQLNGRDARLNCRASGNPKPDIMWFDEENTFLKKSDKYQTLTNGDLVIRDLAWEDVGGYTCVADNKYGRDNITTFLYPVGS